MNHFESTIEKNKRDLVNLSKSYEIKRTITPSDWKSKMTR